MKGERDYIRDIGEIRSMMERSSRFLSLSGLSGIIVGIYALLGAYLAYAVFDFHPDGLGQSGTDTQALPYIIALGVVILILAIGTAIFFSGRKASSAGEKIWNPTSRRLLIVMGVPLATGGLLILILISHGLLGLIAPISLLFYGLALCNASRVTFQEVETLGYIEIALGLIGILAVGYGLLLWAIGFGVMHIVAGIYLHYRYER